MLEKIHKKLESIIGNHGFEALLLYLNNFPELSNTQQKKIAYHTMIICEVYSINKEDITDKKQTTYRIVDARRQLTYSLKTDLEVRKEDIIEVLGLTVRNYYRYIKESKEYFKYPKIHREFTKKRKLIEKKIETYE